MGCCASAAKRSRSLPRAARSVGLSTTSPVAGLMDIDLGTVEPVPFHETQIMARVIDVYDGDTCTVLFMMGQDHPMKIKIRVFGIDTPEMRGKGVQALEKEAARLIRDHTRTLILNRVMPVIFHKWGKYGGRIIGNVFLPSGDTLSDYLLEREMAKPYDGRTAKEDWTDDELQAIINKLDGIV